MVRGLYTAYTGMMHQQKRLDTITNNLANASTAGYKREDVTSKSFNECMTVKVNDLTEGIITRNIGKMSLGVKIGENYTDYTQGSLKHTEGTFDLALDGAGFFAISFTNKRGEESIKYTRDGEFVIDNNGTLRTKDGDYVLNQGGGQIVIPPSAVRIEFDRQGNIYADEEYIDTLQITDFEDYNYLKKYGENLYDTVNGAVEKASDASVRQGWLEMSNINVIKEMVEMITVTRAYEANQKFIQTADSMTDKAVNQVGRVS